MKIEYKDDKRKVDFCKLNNGDLFDYKGNFYIVTNVHDDYCRKDGSEIYETYNTVRLEDGSSCWFDSIEMVTPVEFVGYAEVKKDD